MSGNPEQPACVAGHTCGDEDGCREIGECVAAIHIAAHEAHAAYIRAGRCSGCGACSPQEARGRCRPQSDPSGEYSCAGEDLWRDDEEEDAEDEHSTQEEET